MLDFYIKPNFFLKKQYYIVDFDIHSKIIHLLLCLSYFLLFLAIFVNNYKDKLVILKDHK